MDPIHKQVLVCSLKYNVMEDNLLNCLCVKCLLEDVWKFISRQTMSIQFLFDDVHFGPPVVLLNVHIEVLTSSD